MTLADIAHARLHNQHIGRATLRTAGAVVRWLGAVQAQDFAGAKWALGVRMKDGADDAVTGAFDKGEILRTHLLRPTWHFVTPADLPWLLALTAPRVHAANAFMYRSLELDRGALKRSYSALAKALGQSGHMTRHELRDVLERAGVAAPFGLRLAYIMMSAELDGVVCSGPRRGKQFTYALVDERAPARSSMDRDEALATLAQRFFVSRGPATVSDLAKWSGLTTSEAKRGLEAVSASLRREVVAEETYWLSPGRPTAVAEAPIAHLLSIYDEYMSSYKNRTAMGSAAVGARLTALGNALQFTVVLDGRIVGTWKRTLQKDSVLVDVTLFDRVGSTGRVAISAAAVRYGRFLDLRAVLSVRC